MMNPDPVFFQLSGYFMITMAFSGVGFHAHQASHLAALPHGQSLDGEFSDRGHPAQVFPPPEILDPLLLYTLLEGFIAVAGYPAGRLGPHVHQDLDPARFQSSNELINFLS